MPNRISDGTIIARAKSARHFRFYNSKPTERQVCNADAYLDIYPEVVITKTAETATTYSIAIHAITYATRSSGGPTCNWPTLFVKAYPGASNTGSVDSNSPHLSLYASSTSDSQESDCNNAVLTWSKTHSIQTGTGTVELQCPQTSVITSDSISRFKILEGAIGNKYPVTTAMNDEGSIPVSVKAQVNYSVPARTKYVVKYNANGGSSTPANQDKWHDETLTLQPAISRTGYNFLYWQDSDGVNHTDGKYTGNKATTMKAIWQEKTYTITYNANGGSQTGATTATKKHFTNLSLKAASTVTPIKGHTMGGWTIGSAKTYPNGSPTYTDSTNSNHTVYAYFIPKTFTVTYNGNGSSINRTVTGSTPNSSHTYTTNGNLSNNGFSAPDYVFNKWGTTTSGGTKYSNGASVKGSALSDSGSNITLYALWTYQFTKPSVTAVRTSRLKAVSSGGTTTYVIEDTAGDGARISADITPWKNNYNANGYSTIGYLTSTVKFYYRVHTAANNGSWTLFSTQTCNSVRTLTANLITPLSADLTYDVRVQISPINSNPGHGTAYKDGTIPSVKFTVDFNDDHDTIGLFASAPDKTSTSQPDALYVNGDIWFEVDYNNNSDALAQAIKISGLQSFITP